MGASTYDGILIAALLIAMGFALLPFVAPGAAPPSRPASPHPLYTLSPGGRTLSLAVTIAVSAAYCGGFWSGGRRTLAMKTWRLAMTTGSGDPVGLPRALLRYLACGVGPALAIAGFATLQHSGHGRWALVLLVSNYAWALVDREHRCLQDRLAGTRLVPARR